MVQEEQILDLVLVISFLVHHDDDDDDDDDDGDDDEGRWCFVVIKNKSFRASLVAQWLRICLPMQGTRVRALVWEGPTCRGATGPVSHNY